MVFAVTGNSVNDVVLTNTGHRVHFKLACRARMGIAGFGFCFFDVTEYLFAAQQIAFTRFGQGNATGGTVQKTGLQVRFKV